jgi:V-type H+-transporting ATPase subunit a
LKKARKFLKSFAVIEQHDTEKAKIVGDESGIAMSPLVSNIAEERGTYQADEMTFSNIAGVIATADKSKFERMLFRATRGNCFVRFSPLSMSARDAYGAHIPKVCFIIFFKSDAIAMKIRKICDGYNANRYDLSNLNRTAELEAQLNTNYREMEEAKVVLDRNTRSREALVRDASKHLERWLWIVRREKGIYHTLNLFKNDVAGNLLRGRAWVLSTQVPVAKAALARAHATLNLKNTSMLERVPESWSTPPTHFEINKYTVAFQEFVNTYGVPRYKEANPALFTAATFPFFFGVMYGDIGHGSCLLIGGLFLLFTERFVGKGMDDIMKGMYMARYMLTAMGVMSVYAGLIYNDYFAIGLNLFGSRWTFPSEETGVQAEFQSFYGDAKAIYPFGVDPAWHISSNDLLFFNSMKMKMSVILGIFHMTFGIILKGMNAVFFRSWLDFYTEFLPMIIFDVAFFGYMVILIFVKWSINWQSRMALGTCSYNQAGVIGACTLSATNNCYNAVGKVCTLTSTLDQVCTLGYGGTSGGCQPPNLITTLINIALKPGSVDEPMYSGQAGVQTFILLIAFLCVPCLLFIKPFYLRYQHNQSLRTAPSQTAGVENPLLADNDHDHGHSNPHGSAAGGGHGHGHDGEFNFGEIFIHQAIETIEFVLGMVSNTASYLRLWALSLAHTELANVFWEKAMLSMIVTNNPVLIFFGFAVFAAVTFGVLLAMDVLECFLHALRLHWVEFQNKFYKADGIKFQPFDFKAILDKTSLE